MPSICSRGLMVAGMIGALLAPVSADGQTIREVLEKLSNATRPPGASVSDSDSERAGTGVVESGEGIRVSSLVLEGGDTTVSARFIGDTGVTHAVASAPCGPARACVAGWDLRVARVTAPGPFVPRGAPLFLKFIVENRGRISSPASEAAICYSWYGTVCDERVDIVPIPSLASGASVTIARYIEPGGQAGETLVRVEIDPDQIAEASNRENDVGVSGRIRPASPELQWVGVEVPSTLAIGQSVPVRLRVRNKSTVAPSEAVEVQVTYGAGNCSNIGLYGSQHRFLLPALVPRQTAVVMFRFAEPISPDCGVGTGHGKVFVIADPDSRQVWGPMHEASGERAFRVVAGRSGGRE